MTNQEILIDLLIEYILKNHNKSYLKDFLNIRSDEGFTPIMFCAFRGNIVILVKKKFIKKLELLGADLFAKNNAGLSLVHLAA